MEISTLILTWAGVIVGNYLWQVISNRQNWEKAFEISFFQTVLLVTVLIVNLLNSLT